MTDTASTSTTAEIATVLASSAPRGSFLHLLRLRAAVVETIIGPTPDDDAPRLDMVADLERQMIADPPRTTEEVVGALMVVRDEIRDGFLMSDTIEDFLVTIVESAADFLIDRRPGNERASEGDAQILNLCAEWRETFDLEWPGTPEAADEICQRLDTIEERIGGLDPSTPAGAAAMIGIVIQRDAPVEPSDFSHRILCAAEAGLTRMNTGELPA